VGLGDAANTISDAILVSPERDAVMFTAVSVRRDVVETVKVPIVAPCGMVTLAGTVATFVSLLLKFTVAPLSGAGLTSVIVPVEVCPPVMVDGFNVREAILPGGHLPALPAL